MFAIGHDRPNRCQFNLKVFKKFDASKIFITGNVQQVFFTTVAPKFVTILSSSLPKYGKAL